MFGFLGDALRVVSAPIRLAAAVVEVADEVARTVTKPVADVIDEAAKDMSRDIRSIK